MKFIKGNVYQNPEGNCFKVLKNPILFEGVGEFVVGRFYYAGGSRRLAISTEELSQLKLIYVAPPNHTLNEDHEAFLKEVHNQIKCL